MASAWGDAWGSAWGDSWGVIAALPVQLDQLPNLSAGFDTGEHAYALSAYFSGATSYAIDPAVETGWSFVVGLLTIDTDDEDTFGPYTVTATNDNGDTESNAFTVKVSIGTVRAYRGVRQARGVRSYR
jgi:hypothetical protein